MTNQQHGFGLYSFYAWEFGLTECEGRRESPGTLVHLCFGVLAMRFKWACCFAYEANANAVGRGPAKKCERVDPPKEFT